MQIAKHLILTGINYLYEKFQNMLIINHISFLFAKIKSKFF